MLRVSGRAQKDTEEMEEMLAKMRRESKEREEVHPQHIQLYTTAHTALHCRTASLHRRTASLLKL